MKKILILIGLISILAVPIIGVAQMSFTPDYCTISHILRDYDVCVLRVGGQAVQWLGPDNITGGPFENIGGAVYWESHGVSLTACCLIDKILTIGDYIFMAILVIAVIFILLAAWTFLTSGGEPEKVKKARSYLLFAVIGIAVGFLARILVKVVASIVGY